MADEEKHYEAWHKAIATPAQWLKSRPEITLPLEPGDEIVMLELCGDSVVLAGTAYGRLFSVTDNAGMLSAMELARPGEKKGAR